MKYSIIIPTKDIAANTIYNELVKLEKPKNAEIILYDNESIYLEDIEVNGEILIFATRHRAASGKKSLTCHFPGNWNKADFGGKEKKLCIAPASLLKQMFFNLKKNAKGTEFEVTLEATHHGPSLNKPAMFIELGSSENEWKNIDGGKIIAKTIIETLNEKIEPKKTYLGLGGTHYPVNFSKKLLETDIAISHICPKYALENLDEDMLKQAINKSIEKCEGVMLDWKGLGDKKNRILELLSQLGIQYSK